MLHFSQSAKVSVFQSRPFKTQGKSYRMVFLLPPFFYYMMRSTGAALKLWEKSVCVCVGWETEEICGFCFRRHSVLRSTYYVGDAERMMMTRMKSSNSEKWICRFCHRETCKQWKRNEKVCHPVHVHTHWMRWPHPHLQVFCCWTEVVWMGDHWSSQPLQKVKWFRRLAWIGWSQTRSLSW